MYISKSESIQWNRRKLTVEYLTQGFKLSTVRAKGLGWGCLVQIATFFYSVRCECYYFSTDYHLDRQ